MLMDIVDGNYIVELSFFWVMFAMLEVYIFCLCEEIVYWGGEERSKKKCLIGIQKNKLGILGTKNPKQFKTDIMGCSDPNY